MGNGRVQRHTSGTDMAFDHTGKVKFYNEARKFGFVRLDSGDEAFFHKGACSRNVTPKKDDRVRCEIDPKVDERGPRVVRMVFE